MIFLSTPSARRATFQNACGFELLPISIHALREEGDDYTNTTTATIPAFLSTPSARRATCFLSIDGYLLYDFYPRPPRGGRLQRAQAGNVEVQISIHALREEGDTRTGGMPNPRAVFLSTPSARRATVRAWIPETSSMHFYPRPPRGGRLCRCNGYIVHSRFLSTPSARRAT